MDATETVAFYTIFAAIATGTFFCMVFLISVIVCASKKLKITKQQTRAVSIIPAGVFQDVQGAGTPRKNRRASDPDDGLPYDDALPVLQPVAHGVRSRKNFGAPLDVYVDRDNDSDCSQPR